MTPVLPIDQTLLDTVSGLAAASPRRRRNHNFHHHEADPAHQLLNAVEPDSYIAPHRHQDPGKGEVIVALRGRFGVVVFDDAGAVVQSLIIAPGSPQPGLQIPPGTWHSLVSLDPGGVFFEAKAGP